ncbi:MAG: hypothetical protein JXR68_12125 [Bacteroidales bacterium]|nr:hypothetical protein [Bacteroidales bacterium]
MKTIQLLFTLFLALFSANAYSYEDTDINSLLGVVYDEDGTIINEDEELGAIRRFATNIKDKDLLKRTNRLATVVKKRKAATVSPTITAGQKLMYSKRNELDPKTKEDIEKGRMQFSDVQLYYTKALTAAVTASGIVELVQSNDKIGVGYSNLEDGGRVPAGTACAVNYISLEHYLGVDAADKFGKVAANVMPAAWVDGFGNGAELEIRQDGKVIYTQLVSTMTETRISKNATPSKDGFSGGSGINLNSALIIKPGAALQFAVKFGDGYSVAATGTQFNSFRVKLLGDGINYR